jgi:hypothetical protein
MGKTGEQIATGEERCGGTHPWARLGLPSSPSRGSSMAEYPGECCPQPRGKLGCRRGEGRDTPMRLKRCAIVCG